MYNPQLGLLRFPGQRPGAGEWFGLRVHQGWGQHDLAELRVIHSPRDEGLFVTGMPVALSFGAPGRLRSWIGYLHTVDKYASGTFIERRLQCLGPTYSLGGSEQRAWANTTASAVVDQLCSAQGLSSQSTPTSRIYEHLNQAGLTGWEFINRLARENGRFVFPNGVGVRFLSREAILATFASTAPLVIATQDSSSDVFSWRPVTSDDPAFDGERTAVKSFAGVDARGGHVIRHVQSTSQAPFGSVTGAKLFADAKTSTTVTSAAEAEAHHKAASDRSSWKYRLNAVVRGSSLLAPGLILQVHGIGIYSGPWVIQNVCHTIEGSTYTSDLDLVTDALGELPRQYRNAGSTPRPLPVASPVLRTTTVKDSFATGQVRWQAQNRVPLRALTRPGPANSGARRASSRG